MRLEATQVRLEAKVDLLLDNQLQLLDLQIEDTTNPAKYPRPMTDYLSLTPGRTDYLLCGVTTVLLS